MDDHALIAQTLGLEDQSYVPELMPDNAEDEQQESYESSDDSESAAEDPDQIDEAVREDMDQLEDIFHSKGLKFRMIDRIGEGDICSFPLMSTLYTFTEIP